MNNRKPWHLCSVPTCPAKTFSGLPERDRRRQYCGLHMPELLAARFEKINSKHKSRCERDKHATRCSGYLHPFYPGNDCLDPARFERFSGQPHYVRGRVCQSLESATWWYVAKFTVTPQFFKLKIFPYELAWDSWAAWKPFRASAEARALLPCSRIDNRQCLLPDEPPSPKRAERFVWLLKWGGRYLLKLKGDNRSGMTKWIPDRRRAHPLKHQFAANKWLETVVKIMRRYDEKYTSGRMVRDYPPRLVRFYPGRVARKRQRKETVT